MQRIITKHILVCRFFLYLAISLSFFAGHTAAQETVNVAILPFDIHAQEELAYLQTEIPAAVKKYLENQGANVIVLNSETAAAWKGQVQSPEGYRQFGTQIGSDYIIWGSLTWIGQNFSIDAKLLNVIDAQLPDAYSAEGQGVENLSGTVRKLSQDLSLKIFKREKIISVQVEGNRRIEADAIERMIKTKAGDEYIVKSISDDLKTIYEMGYFDDVRVDSQSVPGGKTIIFRVKEKPTVRSIIVSGNTWVAEEDDIKEVLNLKKGSILNIYVVQNDMRRIEELYKEKNYHNAKIDFKLYDRENNQADIEYVIDEGQKLHIREIKFAGNTAYSDKQLKGVMDTSEESFLSWMSTAGDLNLELLGQDAAKLSAFYHNHGYVSAKIGEPGVAFEEDGIVITIKINEGPQFKVGTVKFEGDLIFPEEQLLEKLQITGEDFYNREVLRGDVLSLTDLYSNEGYAYADVFPKVKQNLESQVADITFEIQKGKQVYFEEIVISGNTKTRDKVIRRQLKVYEQELYSGKRLKQGIRNLYRLDYFEDIKVNTVKGSGDDKMKLDIEVTEKSTGSFSFGAGYGNVENLFGTISVAERNLFGRGQNLSLSAQLGTTTQKVTLSFTEPWMFDMPLSAGFDAYVWEYNFDAYDKNSVGGKVRVGYPLYDYTRGTLAYNYDISDITNVDDTAADSIKDDAGEHTKSSVTARVRWDSRDNLFNPKDGSVYSIEGEYAGLGGDVGFYKTIGETGWYLPLFWQFTGVVHAKAGYIAQLEGMDLPDYEKFYMGGINSLRGFKRDDLSPRDENGATFGGDKFVQFNFELKFPLLEDLGVFGLVFFDTGDIYAVNEDLDFGNLRSSAGPEIRWLSPMGPIRLAYGYILDPQSTDEASGNWEFSMASAF